MPPRPLLAKGNVELQQLQDVVNDILSLRAEIQRRQALGPAPNAQNLDDCCQWARNLAAHANGYLAEFKLYLKHRDKLVPRQVQGTEAQKARLDHSRADLLVGADLAGDPYSKSVQVKAISTDDRNAVMSHIAEAFAQLAGSGGERARTQDRWSANVHIKNPENPWPYTTADQTPATVGGFRAKVREQVRLVWQGLKAKDLQKLASHAVKDPARIGQSIHPLAVNTRPHTTALRRANNQQIVRNDVVVKIYFSPPFGLADPQGTLVWKAVVRMLGERTVAGFRDPLVYLFDPNKQAIP